MDFFKTTRWCLAFVGHNLQDAAKNYSIKTHCLIIFIVASGNIWMISYTVSLIKNLPIATASLSVSMTNMLTVAKIITFLSKKKMCMLQIKQLRDLNEKFKKLERKRRLFEAHARILKFERRYCWLCLITGFYFCLMPLVYIILQILQGQPIVWQLPYPMKLPFLEYESVLPYSILYVYCLFISWYVCFYVPAIDCLFYSYAINVSTHFQILQDIVKANDFKGPKRKVQETITGIAKHHNFLLELSERMRILFKPIIIVQFLMTSLQVCLIVFQIVTNATNLLVLVPNVTFIFVILIQLLIYCHGGEMVMHESLQFNWAIQTSQWDNLSPELRKQLRFIMQRAQKPLVVKAGFYTATLESFMTIVQTAASYITLMQSLD